jgi:hypothetical protein
MRQSPWHCEEVGSNSLRAVLEAQVSRQPCGFIGYAIVAWAMTQAPIAAVATLRETSVVFVTLIGVTLLGEPHRATLARLARHPFGLDDQERKADLFERWLVGGRRRERAARGGVMEASAPHLLQAAFG